MKVFTHTEFKGHYPVGVSAVVVAINADAAADLLMVQLKRIGLPQIIYPSEFREINTSIPAAIILQDGNY